MSDTELSFWRIKRDLIKLSKDAKSYPLKIDPSYEIRTDVEDRYGYLRLDDKNKEW